MSRTSRPRDTMPGAPWTAFHGRDDYRARATRSADRSPPRARYPWTAFHEQIRRRARPDPMRARAPGVAKAAE